MGTKGRRKPPSDRARAIGKRVREMRVAAQLTQEELAGILGVQKQDISSMERGVTSVFDDNRIAAVAVACAGRGWLPNDSELITQYIEGYKDEIAVVIRGEPVPRPAAAWVEKESAPAAYKA